MAGMMDYAGWGNMMSGWGSGLGAGVAILALINILAVIWALLDLMKYKKLDTGVRIGWIVIIISLQIVGVLMYLFAGKKDLE